MPVIITIASLLLGWGLYWFVRLDGHEWVFANFSAARRVRLETKRARKNRDILDRTAVRGVSEPRDAALALLVKLASVDGSVLPAAETVIDEAARETFGFGADLSERRVFADYVARNTPSFALLFRETAALFEKSLAPAERSELVALLERVALAAGGMTPAREDAIAEVRKRLLPARG